MARGNKLSSPRGLPKKSTVELLETIVDDTIKAAMLQFDDWWKLSSFPLVPLAIPVSQGRYYRVTQAGVDAAHELTQQTWDARVDFRQTIEREEFNNLSFTAIGDMILNIRSHLPENAEDDNAELDGTFYDALATDYVENLNQLADKARPDIDRHIPCHLFHSDQMVPAFSVGPVEFRPRKDWINRFITDSVELDYVWQVEAGKLSMDELRKLVALEHANVRNVNNALNVLSSLRGFAWVATIRMIGHELSQSHHKASTIVGLAIDAIGLRFQVEDARCFIKAGRQHLFSEDRLATTVDGKFLRGWSVQMPGLGSAPGALATKMTAERPFLDAAGRILDEYVQGRQTGRALHLVERWANALYWVGEARREASDFMSVVNYGCAADGLSGAGGKAKIMASFAKAALNPKGEPTPAESLSITDAVTAVYCEGRNKLAHGETSGLLEDLSRIRAIGDNLLVNLFDTITIELAKMIADQDRILKLDEKSAYRAFETRLWQRS